MKNICFIRHGKSSWDNPELNDKARPLKKRGKKDAALIGKLLRKKKKLPQGIVSSPAARAFTTAEIVADETGYKKKKIATDDRLYFEGVSGMIELIHALDDAQELVFIFGHNPDLTELLNRFSEKAVDNVPTSGVFEIEFNVKSWKEAGVKNGKLIFFDFPANHR